jgi:hypothetical protein
MRAHKVRRGAKVIRSTQMFKRAFEDAKHVADAELFGKGTVEKSDEVKPVCITLAILFNDGTTKKYVSVADDFEPDGVDDDDFEVDDSDLDDDECECCDDDCDECCDRCSDDDEDDDDEDCDEMPLCKSCDRKADCKCTKIFARCPGRKCGVCTWADASEEDLTRNEIDRLMKRLNELAGKMLAREKAKHHAGK